MVTVQIVRRFAGQTLLGAGLLGTAAAVIVSIARPAAVAAAVAAVQSTITCATTGTTPCLSATNTSSGIGVLGASTTGTGLRGSSNTNNGVKGSSKTSFGVLGTSTSGAAGVAGMNASQTGGEGVLGSTTVEGGIGVLGSAPHGFAIFGQTMDDIAVEASASTSGLGVAANSRSGTAVLAVSDQANAVQALSESTTEAAVFAQGFQNIALEGAAPASGSPLVLTDPVGKRLFTVDGLGNVHNFARTAGGATIAAFTAKTTLPTVEDTGTGLLTGGAAAVRLDPAFAASIDPQTGYRVFLTANGDTRGLYVAAKTGAGFTVRESQGGRATISFDYRIVATALGQSGRRMAVLSPAASRVALPVIRKANLAQRPVPPIQP